MNLSAPILILCFSLAVTWTNAAEFEAGFASIDITPPAGWRRSGGYKEMISTGTHDPLMAKAMVLIQGGVKTAFVGNDLCSVPRDLTDQARKQASAATGIPVENIVITATHTHGAPEYCGPLREALHARAMAANGGTDPQEPFDYHAQLVATWVKVITQAHAKRQEVKLSVVVPQQHGLAFNRRFYMTEGSIGWNPGRLNRQIARPIGPTDPDLPFILVRNTQGRPIGALTVFAMHTAIYGGPEFGACYPGHLQTALRQLLQAPEMISIFGEGCAGDVNHIDVSKEEDKTLDYPKHTGETLARTLSEALPLAREIRTGELAMKSVTIRSPVAPLSEKDYREAKQLMDTLDQNKAAFLILVDGWRKIYQHEFWTKHDGQLPQEVQAIRLDSETAIVTLPHEVFVEIGMRIKAESPFKTTIVVSLANDIDFYIPVRRAFEEGNYEPTTCPLLPDCGERLADAAVKLLHELKP